MKGSHWFVAAIDGQLGQHQTVMPNGQPILEDPRFVKYEKVRDRLCNGQSDRLTDRIV